MAVEARYHRHLRLAEQLVEAAEEDRAAVLTDAAALDTAVTTDEVRRRKAAYAVSPRHHALLVQRDGIRQVQALDERAHLPNPLLDVHRQHHQPIGGVIALRL